MSGHTAYELIKQRTCGGAIVEFGEIVWGGEDPHREEASKAEGHIGSSGRGRRRAHWTRSSWSEEIQSCALRAGQQGRE